MITVTVGVLITVVLLVGFGFLSTASAGWFFKSREPHRPRPHPTRTTDIARQQGIRLDQFQGQFASEYNQRWLKVLLR